MLIGVVVCEKIPRCHIFVQSTHFCGPCVLASRASHSLAGSDATRNVGSDVMSAFQILCWRSCSMKQGRSPVLTIVPTIESTHSTLDSTPVVWNLLYCFSCMYNTGNLQQ